jgi:hypothetical protein
MRPFTQIFFIAIVAFTAASLLLQLPAQAQPGLEPPVRGIDEFRTPLDYDLRRAASFNIAINNYGFAVSGEYRRVVSPLSELYAELQMTALRDVTEQNYQFFGQQIIPNKRNRVLAFPLMIGYRHRLFPQSVSDNFRFFAFSQAGPTVAFVYPYYDTVSINYVLERDLNEQGLVPEIVQFGPVEANLGQFVNDVFQGWGDGSWKFGTSGKIGIGVDFGEAFKTITTIKVGVTISHFPDGIQVMDPFNALGIIPGTPERPDIYVVSEGAASQKLFTSPFITLSFGGMW